MKTAVLLRFTLVIAIALINQNRSRPAIAQAAAPTPALMLNQRAITVTGLGQVAVPPDEARLEFRFSSRDSFSSPTPTGLRLQGQLTAADLRPVVEALRKLDIPGDRLTLQTSPLENPRLLVRLDRPTQERVQQVVQTVDQATTQAPRLTLQSIGAAYAVRQCEPLERAVRRLALNDARRQSIALAQELNVQLGDLLLAAASPLQGSPTSVGCGSKIGASPSPLGLPTGEATPPYDPSEPVEVRVRSQIGLTYGIRSPDTRVIQGQER